MRDDVQDDSVLGDDSLRLVDVLLEEACGAPTRSSVLPMRTRPGTHWWVAAMVLLGVGVMVGSALLQRAAEVPLQEPVPPVPVPVPVPNLPDLRAALKRRLDTLVAIETTDWVGEGIGSLTQWGPEPKAAVGPRIADPRELRLVGDERGVQHRGVPLGPLESSPSPAGAPALGLLRDVLPGAASGNGVVRAVVHDASLLDGEPGHLQVLHCIGGDPARLAAALPRFPGLLRLQLGPLLDDGVAAALGRCRSLIALDAGTAGLGDEGMLALGTLPALRSLTLRGELTGLSGQTLAALKGLQSLRLDDPLPPSNLRDRRRAGLLQAVFQLPGLKELQISLSELPPDSNTGESGLQTALAAMSQLRWLSIVVVDGGSLDSLARAASSLPLERLRLGGGQLSTAAVEAIVGNRGLRQLDLGGVQFVDPQGALVAMAKASHLRRLGLAFTNLSRETTDSLLDALPECIVQTGQIQIMPDGRRVPTLHDYRASRDTGR